MGTSLTPTRVSTILSRQFPPRYGSDYIPSILATPAEAPAISRPAIRHSTRLGRELHALSISELKALLLAVGHPDLVDLRENAAYDCGPALHPFAGHPAAWAERWPATSGTMKLAAAMGVFRSHPRVKLANEEAGNDECNADTPQKYRSAYWIGDLLILMRDERGLYTLDWDIKLMPGEHGRPGPGRTSPRAKANAEARYRVVQAFDEELEIRRVEVAGTDIDSQLFRNLDQLNGWSRYQLKRASQEIVDLEHSLRESMRCGNPPLTIFVEWIARGWRSEELRAGLYQAIWHRRILVDLFKPINIDRELKPQERCPYEVYAHLFCR